MSNKSQSKLPLDIENIDLEKLKFLVENPELINKFVSFNNEKHQQKMDTFKEIVRITVSALCLGVGLYFSTANIKDSGMLIGGGLAGLGLSTSAISVGLGPNSSGSQKEIEQDSQTPSTAIKA